jgi:hypothetical protein
VIAEKGASRNRFWAFLRAGVDAGQIQDYRQKLQQCLGTFGASTVPRRGRCANTALELTFLL